MLAISLEGRYHHCSRISSCTSCWISGFEQQVKPRMRQRTYLIRYADDFVIGFNDYRDAQRVMDVIPKRFDKYGLMVHPTKTKLVPFCRPPLAAGPRRGTRPGTFDLLGFTHYWAKVSARSLGHQTEDGLRPFQPSGAKYRLMVPRSPALVGSRTATEAE